MNRLQEDDMGRIVKVNGIDVDEEKAQKLLRRVVMLEKKTLQRKDKNQAKIVAEIKKMIEEEVQCY